MDDLKQKGDFLRLNEGNTEFGINVEKNTFHTPFVSIPSPPSISEIKTRVSLPCEKGSEGMQLLFDGDADKKNPTRLFDTSKSLHRYRKEKNPMFQIADESRAPLTEATLASGGSPLRFRNFLMKSPHINLSNKRDSSDSGSESDERESSREENSNKEKGSIESQGTSSAVSRAEDYLTRQQGHRLQLSSHYQRLRESMRPPSLITLDERAENPSLSRKFEKEKEKERKVSEENQCPTQYFRLSDQCLESFSPRTRNVEVKRLLLKELSATNDKVQKQKTTRNGTITAEETPSYMAFNSRREFFVKPPPKSARARGSETTSNIFVTNVVLPQIREKKSFNKQREFTSDSEKQVNEDPSILKKSMNHPLENDFEVLNQDPSVFTGRERDYRHTQHYREVASARLGPQPKPPMVREGNCAPLSSDVRDFLFSLSNRSGQFNDAALDELNRVRVAQKTFFDEKKRIINDMLDSPGNVATPAERLMSQVRRDVVKKALNKDIGERLDVYYEHLERLERYMISRLSEDDVKTVQHFISLVKKDVGQTDACLGPAGFIKAYRHFKFLYGNESLLETHNVDMLRLLSTMYGITREQFRHWLHKRLRRYEPKDLDAVFRNQDAHPEKDLPKARKIKLTILKGKGLLPADSLGHHNVYIRIIVESNIFVTSPKQLAGGRVSWDKQFFLSLLDDRSFIRFQVVIDEVVQAESHLCAASFAVGSQLNIQIPMRSSLLPNATLDIELFCSQMKEFSANLATEQKASRSVIRGQSLRNEDKGLQSDDSSDDFIDF